MVTAGLGEGYLPLCRPPPPSLHLPMTGRRGEGRKIPLHYATLPCIPFLPERERGGWTTYTEEEGEEEEMQFESFAHTYIYTHTRCFTTVTCTHTTHTHDYTRIYHYICVTLEEMTLPIAFSLSRLCPCLHTHTHTCHPGRRGRGWVSVFSHSLSLTPFPIQFCTYFTIPFSLSLYFVFWVLHTDMMEISRVMF